jgi:hypothetical protein
VTEAAASAALTSEVRTRSVVIDFPESPPRWVIAWHEDSDGRVTRGIFWVPVESLGATLGRLVLPDDLGVLPLYHALKIEIPPEGLAPGGDLPHVNR